MAGYGPYSCETLGCLCLAFKTDSIGKKFKKFFDMLDKADEQSNDCVLPNGQLLRKARRREYRTLTDEERADFHYAMWTLKNNGVFDVFVGSHFIYSDIGGAHAGPAFLLWHRELLKRFVRYL
jgi:hypothetical protein